MWVLFAPDAGTDPLWQTLEENEFFELQAYKPATSSKNETSLLSMLTALPSSLLATSRAPSLIGGGTEENFPYRILLKTQPPYGQRHAAKQQSKEAKDSGSAELSSVADSSHGGSRAPAQVIALAKDLRVIKEHWNWLVNDMSTACSFFTRESEKEENELWDFLLMKFTSMAQQEAKKREMQREREREKAMERERQLEIATFVDNKHKYAKKQANIMINEEEEEDNKAKERRFEEMDQSRQALWKKLFPKISTIERLIVEYPCSLERKGVERRGLLLVTPRHVCFHSPRLNTRVAIYWRVITSLSRATAVNGTVPAIYVTCLGAYHEEFLFHSLADFEQTMGLLVRIWHMALLEEAADRDGDEEAKARLMGITREQLLCEIEREKHRKIFRMPKEELLIAEFCGSLWMENIIQVYEGTLHISANYVCFYADVEGHSFSVVIPFREVLDIISVDSKLIQVNTHSNKHCCELMVQLWSRRIRSSERLLEKVPPAEGPWDDFGFVGLGPIVKDSKHFRSDYAIKQKLQRKRWEEYIGKYGWGIQMLKTSDALRDIVRYGIPDELKGGLWQIFLGSAHSFCIKPGEYQNLLKQFDGKNSDAISEIERDVNRSFPEHPYFQSESGKQALRNVLIAYSWRNPSLGYCQSMNIICSLLLLFMGEEEAFWALTILCEELFPQYFTPDMLGSMTDQHVLEDLVAEHFPKLNAHLESIQLPLVLISFPWFMCLFIGYIPMQTSIRILDILFCEGYDSTFMFKVALAVFKFNQKFILNTRDFSKLVIQLKFTNLDCDTLLEITEDFWWVTSKLINEMRDYHRFQLLKESKTPAPPIASPSGTPLSARSTSAPTHFPRAPSTPVQTPTPTPSSSPPLPTYMTMPIRTRSDSSLFATAKTPLGPMSIPEGTTGSLTTIPFLTSADMSGVGSPGAQPPMSAPPGYMVKTPSPSPTPRKVQFDGTSIPFVGGATDNKIMSALTRLSSKERLSRAEEDESTSTDATGSDDDESTSSMDDSSDTDSSDDDDTVSSETVSETERVTDPAPAGLETADETADKEESRSARRRKAKREQEEAEREQLFHLELDPKPAAADTTAEQHSSGTAPAADAQTPTDGEVPAGDGAKTPVDEAARLAGGSKSEPSTPLRVTHSDDVLDANDAEKEKRRKRKIKSRRRRLASLGRTRSRKSRERVGNRLKGDANADDSGDVFEPEPDDADEREKRIVRLDLDLNLAWRKSTAAEDRAGADGNKGVKYLQRFLFKKRRRHSDGYLDIIKEDDASLVSPRTRTGDDSGEPSVTHRRFFVEEDEGEERETTFGEPDAPDSARREKGKEKETVIERRRSQTDTMFSPRYRPGEHEAAPAVASSSSADLRATESLATSGTSALGRTAEGLFASSSSGVRAVGRAQQQRPPQPTQESNGGERKEKEKEKEKDKEKEEEESEDESSSETDESERDDELKSSIFITSTTHIPRVRKTKKVRERRASVANLLKKEPSGRLLDHAGAFVERKRAEQLEEDFLIRTAGAAVAAAAGKRSDEMSPVHSLKAMDRIDSKPSGLALEQSHATPLKRSKEAAAVVDQISAAVAGDLAPAVVMKATVTPGGRSPPLLPKIEELREDLTSSADEDSGSDGDLAGRELGTSPEGGRRKKIRSKLRNSRRLSLSEPNLNLATSPPSHHPHHHHHHQQRGRSNSKAAARQQQAADEFKRAEEEEWERTSDDESSTRHRRGAFNAGGGDRSDGDSDGSDSDRDMRGSDDGRSSLDYGQSSSGGGHHRRSEDGERPEGGSGRRRAKFFKYSADILAKTKAAGGRDKDRERERDRGERDDRKRIEEQRRRDKDRTKEEEREKRKKERMDEKEARRRSKEDKERRKVLGGGGDHYHGDHHKEKEKEKEKEREKERDRDGLDDSDKKRRHKEEKEMKRRKEEEEKESRRKRKEEEKELKKQHKLEKRKDASPSEVDERGGDGGGGGSDIVGKDKQHKKAFGLLPLPHLHHGHSLSFHLPSSPRRNTGGGGGGGSSSAASNGMLKTPPSPRAHIAPITFNRATPHPQAAQEGSPRRPTPSPAPSPASTNSSRDAMTSSDDSLTQ